MTGILLGWLLAAGNNFSSIHIQKVSDAMRQWILQSIRFSLLAVFLFGGVFVLKTDSFLFILSYFLTHFILLVRDLIRINRLNYA